MGASKRCKVICKRGRKNPRLTHDGSREWVTVIETVNSAGDTLPPMIINKGEGHYIGQYAGVKKHNSAMFSYSSKGWTDQKLGLEYLVKNFEQYSVEQYVYSCFQRSYTNMKCDQRRWPLPFVDT